MEGQMIITFSLILPECLGNFVACKLSYYFWVGSYSFWITECEDIIPPGDPVVWVWERGARQLRARGYVQSPIPGCLQTDERQAHL